MRPVQAGAIEPRAILLSSLLCVASVTFLFALAFPWQHHNESLVWAIDLPRLSFWDSLLPGPVKHVSTYRPLGIAVAWSTFRLTDGGLWLQQLVNYGLTVFAWLLAASSVRDRLSFAWLSFICGGVFFSGYIYLFHLHGVFYGPLLLFIAWLLVQDQRLGTLSWATIARLLGAATLASLFHTFAFLLFAAFLAGRCIQDRLQRKPVNLAAVAAGIAVAAAAVVVLTHGSQSVAAASALQGMVTSYRALEVSSYLGLVPGLLAVAAAASLPTPRQRIVFVGGAILASLALAAAHLPVLFAWVGICCLKALWLRRFAVAALLAGCALLPVATGTGSPTYVLFTLMPAITVSLEGFEPGAALHVMQRRLAVAAIAALSILFVAIRSDAFPPLDGAVRPLLAEKEKTVQLVQMFEWLRANPRVGGDLSLCQPADYPSRTGTAALERRHRAPTDAFSFAYYLAARFGARLTTGPDHLFLCFGGEITPAATQLYAIPGRWAGPATLQRLQVR